jgi:hypothetical protein
MNFWIVTDLCRQINSAKGLIEVQDTIYEWLFQWWNFL